MCATWVCGPSGSALACIRRHSRVYSVHITETKNGTGEGGVVWFCVHPRIAVNAQCSIYLLGMFMPPHRCDSSLNNETQVELLSLVGRAGPDLPHVATGRHPQHLESRTGIKGCI